MSGVAKGQVWRTPSGLTVTIEEVTETMVTYSSGENIWTIPVDMLEARKGSLTLCEKSPAPTQKPTIKLRIRVGVTADGTWLAIGSNLPDMIKAEDERDAAFQQTLREDGAGPVAAWHWITAEVPMPEVEQGEVAGEVEP